jgi:hypothetical protein
MNTEMEWWGYSTTHGWVVLDRSIACNAPGIKVRLEFVRARDGLVYEELREKWDRPQYRFAPNYLKELKGDESTAAAAELEAFKAAWPEIQARIRAEREAAAAREEARRIEQEEAQKAEKKAGARKKKLPVVEEPQ